MNYAKIKQLIPFKPYISGLASYLVTKESLEKRGSRYFYSVWLRHLAQLNAEGGFNVEDAIVGEVGPGTSLGCGFAALLCGARKYFALDLVKHCNTNYNLRVFDELVELFKARTPIPNAQEFPRVHPPLQDYGFPEFLKSEYLDPARVAAIRKCIAQLEESSKTEFIEFYAPWSEQDLALRNSVDLIFSQAVLEHVDDLDSVYGLMKSALRSGGLISHEIDFKSHGTSPEWNGHWKYSDFQWKIVRGKRKYVINRQPISYHRQLLEKWGFKPVHEILNSEHSAQDRYSGSISRARLAEPFRILSDEDLATKTAYLMAAK